MKPILARSPWRLAAGLLLAATGVTVTPASGVEPASATAAPSAADFARLPDFSQVSLSPDGQYLAAIIHDGDSPALAVLRVADLKPVAAMRTSARNGVGVGSYAWDGPTRIVASLIVNDDMLGAISYTGELASLDVTTDVVRQWSGGGLLDATPENPESILVTRNNGGRSTRTYVYRVGRKSDEVVAGAPGPAGAWADFLTDWQGNLRYATVIDYANKREYLIFRRNAEGTAWVEATDLSAKRLNPTWITHDGVWTYFTSDNGKLPGRFCLLRQHTDGSGPLEEISCQEGVDFLGLLKARDGNSIIASYSEPGMPALNFLADNADTALLDSLQAGLDNELVMPVSSTLDGRLWVLKAASDRDPGIYYLCARDTQKCQSLFRAYEHLPLAAMRPTRAVRYAARDGQTIRGFLTLPAARPDGRKPPLVVLPHGGPVGVRDDWFFNPETQLLATHGYAVLRVNYRGSSGYGEAFEQTAKRQWGKALIDDITDGTRHVIKEGLVDPDRVGIYGGSYGGYAALMSGVREPELYKVVVTFAGVSDLSGQTEDTDTAHQDAGVSYLKTYIGDDPADLKAQSPLTYIDRLKAPVMIAHGKDDARVPYSQAERLRAALDARHHPYEWFVRASEGHGFTRLENRQAFNEALLNFLDKNLKNQPATTLVRP